MLPAITIKYIALTQTPSTTFSTPIIFGSPDEVHMQKVNSKSKISKQKNIDPVITKY